jgi:hypothetical protein
MSDQIQAESTVVTPASVVSGLGYPADRKEQSPHPTGWQHTLSTGTVTNVSRETSR